MRLKELISMEDINTHLQIPTVLFLKSDASGQQQDAFTPASPPQTSAGLKDLNGNSLSVVNVLFRWDGFSFLWGMKISMA